MQRPIIILLLIGFVAGTHGAMLVSQGDWKISEGFKVSLVANVRASRMAFDAAGHPILSAGGQIADVSGFPIAKISEPISAFIFDGADLIVATRTGIFRYRESSQTPQRISDIADVRTIRRGPDGTFYFSSDHSLFRLGEKTKAVAAGFVGPQDFDFNSSGDIFAIDADLERDFFLPWYVPTRLYHVALAQDHGWKGASIKPEYFADTVEAVTPIGRVSPGGIAIYRHVQFPMEYREGVFVGDEAGKIFFCKLQKQGATYRPRLDVFLESANTNFVPQQMSVGPDGSLFVLTRNSLVRIEYPGERGQGLTVIGKAREVLQAPQPLEAWSRAKWVPQARQVGDNGFRDAINDPLIPDTERVRAIEVYSELFGPISDSILKDASVTKSAAVRARAAWALAQNLSDSKATLLRRLAQDTDSTVRRVALESILVYEPALNPTSLLPILRQNLDHPDKRLRQAAARLCARLPIPEWEKLWDVDTAYSVQTELSILLAGSWRNPALREEIFWRTLETMPLLRDNSTRLQALRLLSISLGDSGNYELANPPSEEFLTNALPWVRRIFAGSDPLNSMESARLLAMLQDDSAATIEKIEEYFDGQTSPTPTFHYLVVLSKLRGPWPETLAPKVAEFIKTFEAKLPERERRPDQNWKERLREITDALVEKEPHLRELL
jgi:hypothetical protein